MKWLLIILIAVSFLFPFPVKASICPLESKYSFASNNCEKIHLPEHGVLNNEKTDWNCEVGFKKIASQNICQKVVVPEHGKLNYSGDDSRCSGSSS
jgi:hypothetical protein